MRRLFLLLNLLLVSLYCFAQQNLPGKITGKIPGDGGFALYQIQVGSFLNEKNAENAALQLKRNALNPVNEKYREFTRVMIKGIPAGQVVNFLAVIKKAGFNEVIIRENTAASISEKWEISAPGSAYSSFEFNRDMNYIAVENNSERTTHFGEYSMPQYDIINMDKLGVVKITNSNNEGVNFTFSSKDEPKKEINFTAAKAKRIAASPELDLFCRTWKVVKYTEPEYIGCLLFISNAGTYFFTTPDGESSDLSSWRWYGSKKEEFEYSHDMWAHYGRAKIIRLTLNSLEIFDPGYIKLVPGYSNAGANGQWELVPAGK